MRDTFVRSLLEEARSDPSIILITGDLGYGVLEDFQRELPNQFINAGVAEQTMMGMAAGVASTGKRVFVYSIGNFPTLRCLEQIRNDVCLMNNSVVIVSVGAGYAYGSQGYTHHALEDMAVLRALPNMEVIAPADQRETEILTRMLVKSRKPSYLRLGKSGEPNIHSNVPEIHMGKFVEIFPGNQGTLIFSGSIGTIALAAREVLAERGLDVAVVSAPFVSTLDTDYLRSASTRGPIVTIEEHSSRGGLGSAILENASQNRISADIRIIASLQKDLSQIGDQKFLRSQNGLTVESVVAQFIAE